MMRKEKGAVQGMTREEAICQLEDLKKRQCPIFGREEDDCDDGIRHRDAEALNIAISALRETNGGECGGACKKTRPLRMTCDEMLRNLESIANKHGMSGSALL